MSTPPQALFAGLIDDAAMFPPGNANAETAIAEHLRYRGSWFADLIGPLLVPARAFDAFTVAHQAAGSPQLAIVLIGTTSPPLEIPAGMALVGFEAPVPDVPLPPIPAGLSLAAEIETGPAGERVLHQVAAVRSAGARVVGKFRTGGTTAESFPTEDELAAVVCAANAVPVPFKLTAGLHHGVRCTDAATGFEHHGFLNVIVAATRAMAGADRTSVTEALALRSEVAVAAEVQSLDADQVSSVRGRFVSFGCCGVEDPVSDLVELGLVEEPR